MKDDLKILIVEYVSNHWLDLPQIFNLGVKLNDGWNEVPIEDDLKIFKVEILRKPTVDLTQIQTEA